MAVVPLEGVNALGRLLQQVLSLGEGGARGAEPLGRRGVCIQDGRQALFGGADPVVGAHEEPPILELDHAPPRIPPPPPDPRPRRTLPPGIRVPNGTAAGRLHDAMLGGPGPAVARPTGGGDGEDADSAIGA